MGIFPTVVRIETTNACNAQCIMCPHSKMDRRVRIMSDELFNKIIDECSQHRISEVHLHNFGEPLLDAELENKIRITKNKCKCATKIFTNGSLLTQARISTLLNSGIDIIKISVDGATPDEFEKTRPPLKWNNVKNNIKNLIEARNLLRSSTKIFVTCCTGRSVTELIDFPVDFAIGPKHNWGGQHGNKKNSKYVKCNRLWRTFTILVDGSVAQCHADVHGKYILGNVNTDTIQNIWNNEEYKKLRMAHEQSRQSELALCCDCSQCRS